jgi:phage shock protein C
MPKHHHHHHHYYGEGPRNRDGYAYHAGEPGPGPNRHKLYRNTRKAKVAGVCAGIADYFGIKVKFVRLAFILGSVIPPLFPAGIIAYGVLAFVLKPGEPMATRYADPEEEQFWRAYSVRPKATMSELKHRFRAIDARIAQMEHAVTSNEFGLRREFRDLERGV